MILGQISAPDFPIEIYPYGDDYVLFQYSDKVKGAGENNICFRMFYVYGKLKYTVDFDMKSSSFRYIHMNFNYYGYGFLTGLFFSHISFKQRFINYFIRCCEKEENDGDDKSFFTDYINKTSFPYGGIPFMKFKRAPHMVFQQAFYEDPITVMSGLGDNLFNQDEVRYFNARLIRFMTKEKRIKRKKELYGNKN